MDIISHWGVFRNLREEIEARAWILLRAIALGAIVLTAFAVRKWQSDPVIVWIAVAGMLVVFACEAAFLRLRPPSRDEENAG